jgi:hypothetical protein
MIKNYNNWLNESSSKYGSYQEVLNTSLNQEIIFIRDGLWKGENQHSLKKIEEEFEDYVKRGNNYIVDNPDYYNVEQPYAPFEAENYIEFDPKDYHMCRAVRIMGLIKPTNSDDLVLFGFIYNANHWEMKEWNKEGNHTFCYSKVWSEPGGFSLRNKEMVDFCWKVLNDNTTWEEKKKKLKHFHAKKSFGL